MQELEAEGNLHQESFLRLRAFKGLPKNNLTIDNLLSAYQSEAPASENLGETPG
jgi:hypothetical protein